MAFAKLAICTRGTVSLPSSLPLCPSSLNHQVPFDTMRLVFPPVPAAVIALCLYVPLAQLVPLSVGRALFAGGLIGYISYDLVHYYVHHGSPRPGSYFASLKAYHVAHHYLNYKLGQTS